MNHDPLGSTDLDPDVDLDTDPSAVPVTVNGVVREVRGGATDPLLDVLRDQLGLPSVREGCGVGMCGSCTVLVDGEPQSSCLILTPQMAGHEVTTLEGLRGADGELSDIQEAFLRHTAFQCSYCTPGFVLATVGLLRQVPDPTDEQIRRYLAGNICRCGSYSKIFAAVKDIVRDAASTAAQSIQEKVEDRA